MSRINSIKRFIEEKTRELNCIPDIVKIKEQEDDYYEVDIDGDIWSNYCSINEVDTIVAVLFKGIEIGQQMDWQHKNIERYEALLGPNTKQFWLYDSENDTYIDPPLDVLNEIEKIRWKDGEETADRIDAAEDRLVELANENPDWLHDGNEYDAETTEI